MFVPHYKIHYCQTDIINRKYYMKTISHLIKVHSQVICLFLWIRKSIWGFHWNNITSAHTNTQCKHTIDQINTSYHPCCFINFTSVQNGIPVRYCPTHHLPHLGLIFIFNMSLASLTLHKILFETSNVEHYLKTVLCDLKYLLPLAVVC